MEGVRNRSRTRLFRDVQRSASEPATRGRTKEKPRDGRGSLACAHCHIRASFLRRCLPVTWTVGSPVARPWYMGPILLRRNLLVCSFLLSFQLSNLKLFHCRRLLLLMLFLLPQLVFDTCIGTVPKERSGAERSPPIVFTADRARAPLAHRFVSV